jgi:hypothetical protein
MADLIVFASRVVVAAPLLGIASLFAYAAYDEMRGRHYRAVACWTLLAVLASACSAAWAFGPLS